MAVKDPEPLNIPKTVMSLPKIENSIHSAIKGRKTDFRTSIRIVPGQALIILFTMLKSIVFHHRRQKKRHVCGCCIENKFLCLRKNNLTHFLKDLFYIS